MSKVVDPDVRRDIHIEPEILPVVISTEAIVSGRVSKVVAPDVRRGIRMEPEILPVVLSTDDVEPLAVPVVALTRSRVERPLVVAWPVDEVLFGRVSNVGMSDVSRDICMEPDLLPVVMSTDDVEPLAVPVVALTRPRVEGPLDIAWPVNVDAISRAAVYPDLLSGRVMKSVDPDDDPWRGWGCLSFGMAGDGA